MNEPSPSAAPAAPLAAAPAAGPGSVAAHRETTALLGMTVFVASWVMLFASLFFAYAVVRVRAILWPPPNLPPLPLGLPALGTGLLALASGALLALVRFPAGLGSARRRLAGAFAGGAGFLLVQMAVWRDLWTQGLRPTSGPYGSVFYGLTAFHALHVAVGLCAVLVLFARAHRPGARLGQRVWAVYFHTVGALWLAMLVGVYWL